jgi:lactoylglutathione lyase
MESLPLG